MGMNFLFACGGTAGHINPALAIAGEIRRLMPDAKILFVGSGRKMENRLIPLAGYELVNIKMSGFTRKLSPKMVVSNLATVKNLAASGRAAAKLIREFAPDAVIGTGGYVCYSVLKKAAQMKISTFIHESNALPGLATKLLSSNVTRVLVSFPGLESRYRKPDRVVFTGTPVRYGFSSLNKERERQKLGLPAKPLIVSFWGSLGAERMNAALAEFIKCNIDDGRFNHIHATGGGKDGQELMISRLDNFGISGALPAGIEVRAYIDDMPAVMAAADIVLCRAGASTIAELTVMGKPAVLVPSPYVTNNHQEENAKQVQNAGGAVMIKEQDCTGRGIYEVVAAILGDGDVLTKMSEAQKALAVPNAAAKIVELIISECC